MNKNKKEVKPHEHIAIGDVAHLLGLPEVVVKRWIIRDPVPITYDHRGRPSLPATMVEKLSLHSEYEAEFKISLCMDSREEEQRNSDIEAIEAKKQRAEVLETYESYIKDLAKLHSKYLATANKHPFESAVVAAYLLFSRAISLLHQGCSCLKNGYWYTGAILREIDEVVDVAHYFVVTEGTEEGKTAVRRWFRQNKAPKHNVCRRALAESCARLNPEYCAENQEALLNEQYQKKSKWVHPTFSAIREVTRFVVKDQITIDSIDYESCSREYKLEELIDFYRSSIWTCFQTFFLCFKHTLPLTDEDSNLLLSYDKLFHEWE